jgi:hypothetical protein
MRPTLSYLFISLFTVVFYGNAWSQNTEQQPPTFKPSSGLALGIDLAPTIVGLFDKDRSGFGFSGRINIKQKIFGVVEIGIEKTEFNKSQTFETVDSLNPQYFDGRLSYQYAYNSNGTYIKSGLDFNLFKVDEINNNDNVLVGIRYGYAIQKQESPSFTIGNGYWPDYASYTSYGLANTHWIELLFGIRTEIAKNLYMGWTIRASRIISQQHEGTLEPASIPGFGKYRSNVNAGFSYTIEYQLPFSKRKQ